MKLQHITNKIKLCKHPSGIYAVCVYIYLTITLAPGKEMFPG